MPGRPGLSGDAQRSRPPLRSRRTDPCRVIPGCIWKICSIGEAAKNVSEEIQKRYAVIQWREMIALRNIVAHAYFGMNDEIIWDLVQNKVPELFGLVTKVLSKIK